jgi:MarR family transcriptional regulator, organic hydroperoxide resistance regulator
MAASEKLQPSGETLQFMQRMWDFVHALDVRSKRMMQSIGVTGPQRLVIRLVGQQPGQTASDIASMLGKHPSTLTGVLARLERRRLIQRTADRSDRRRMHLTLTARGAAIDRMREGTAEVLVRTALRRASPGARAGAQDVLTRVAEALGDSAKQSRPAARKPAVRRGGRTPS